MRLAIAFAVSVFIVPVAAAIGMGLLGKWIVVGVVAWVGSIIYAYTLGKINGERDTYMAVGRSLDCAPKSAPERILESPPGTKHKMKIIYPEGFPER